MIKKLLIALLIILPYIPYLTYSTKVEERHDTYRHYNCTVKEKVHYNRLFDIGSTYYTPIHNFMDGRRFLVPYFFIKEEVFGLKCADKEFVVGYNDDFKIGDKVGVDTSPVKISVLGHAVAEEESIVSYGTGWDGKKEGETIATVLINHKEVKMFGGKPIKN